MLILLTFCLATLAASLPRDLETVAFNFSNCPKLTDEGKRDVTSPI